MKEKYSNGALQFSGGPDSKIHVDCCPVMVINLHANSFFHAIFFFFWHFRLQLILKQLNLCFIIMLFQFFSFHSV